MSIVVHLRLSDMEMICIDNFLKSSEPLSETEAMKLSASQRVKLFISAMVRNPGERPIIKRGTEDSSGESASIVKSEPLEPKEQGQEAPADDIEAIRERLRSRISSSLNDITQPSVELDPDIWGPDPSALPDPGGFSLDLAKVDTISIEDAEFRLGERRAASDKWLASLKAAETDPALAGTIETRALRVAIRIVYCALPTDMWGDSEVCNKMIKRFMNMVTHSEKGQKP